MVKKVLAHLFVRRSKRKDRDLAALEARQLPNDCPHFNDSFYFCGRGADGTSLVFRLGFRPAQRTELWCDLILPGLGRFRAPSSEERDSGRLSCAGLRFQCRQPAREWAISYAGPMDCGGNTVTVRLDLVFRADSAIVDFGAHGDSRSLAGYLAAEKWNRAWFEKLRDLRQIHYEQGGTLSGRIEVDGRAREVCLQAVRDHSFGARNWRAMRRHVWLMALLDDGSNVNVSLVSYDFLPYMHSGYRIADGATQPVSQAPGFGELPAVNAKGSSFDCRFRVGKGAPLTLQCRVDDLLEYSMNGEYKFFEGLASFSLGALTGVGICEYGFAGDGLTVDHTSR